MRMEQYLQCIDYTLWEIVENGNAPIVTKTVDEKSFGGNKESKKTQKTLLKQQYENFNRSTSEGLDQTYDRLQKLISQLEILGETISQEDMNMKALREKRNREPVSRNVIVETTKTKALVAQDRHGYDWSDQAKEGPTNFALMAYTSSEKFENSSKNLSKLLEIQVSDKFKNGVGFNSQVFNSQVNGKYKTGKGYHAIPPTYTGNFMPPKPDLVLANKDEYIFSESITSVLAVATSKVKTSESKPKSVSEPLIEDWISDSEDENETESKSKQRKSNFAKVEFVKSNKHVKSSRESIKKIKFNKQAKYPRKNSQNPRGNKRNWNNLMTQKLGSKFEFKNKACYVCGSFNHLIKDCDFYEKKMAEKPVWNNARRVNHQNSQRMSHPNPKRNFVPRALLMKSGLKILNTAK
ncbi:ribonuclease H-like domain-containing protein [Tanacetum coccineum]